MEATLHTVIGAGQVGSKLARVLLARGHRVRLVRRGVASFEHPRLRWHLGDISDASFAAQATRGSEVVYNCTNPGTYHSWDRLLPPVYRAIIEAAARAQARLVVLENVYMYGRPANAPFTEESPIAPTSAMGELRAQLTQELFDAHRRGDVRATAGMASDFFGPDSPNASIFRDRLIQRLLAGKPAEVLGDPQLPHSYSYTPDVAEGLAILGSHENSLGRHWHLPVAHQGSTAQLIEYLAQAAGVQARLKVVPSWLLTALGLVSPTLRSVGSMLYQWQGPFLLDDHRFTEAFGVQATPVESAAAATVASHGASVASLAA